MLIFAWGAKNVHKYISAKHLLSGTGRKSAFNLVIVFSIDLSQCRENKNSLKNESSRNGKNTFRVSYFFVCEKKQTGRKRSGIFFFCKSYFYARNKKMSRNNTESYFKTRKFSIPKGSFISSFRLSCSTLAYLRVENIISSLRCLLFSSEFLKLETGAVSLRSSDGFDK